MSQAVFFRVLESEDKAASLLAAIHAPEAATGRQRFHVDPASFAQVPRSPFAYWVSEHVRQLFRRLPPFESCGRRLRLGDHPSDDFRYLRLFWEVSCTTEAQRWPPYYKGGENAPWFTETALVVDWDSSRQTYRAFFGRPGRSNERPSNYEHFFLPGLTCPNRPHRRGYFSHVPPGGVFGHTSPIVHQPKDGHWATCALLNSNAFVGLLHLLMPRGTDGGQTLKYEVGYVRSVPIPQIDSSAATILGQHAIASYKLMRSLAASVETSHVFSVPAVMRGSGITLSDRLAARWAVVADIKDKLAQHQHEVDRIAFSLYGIDVEDRRSLAQGVHAERVEEVFQSQIDEEGGEDDALLDMDAKPQVAAMLSYAIGCVFGRWDSRFANGEKTTPDSVDPFAPLPVCPPGILQNEAGLPVTKEEFQQLKTESVWDYPIEIPWEGVLVDSPGHASDIEVRVRQALEVIWRDHAEAIEHEACEILGVRGLRDHFRKPTAFFDDHLKRYSKSRRQAPIYWPLSTPSGSYTLWIYYHRLTDQTLYTCVNDFVEPKLKQVAGEAARLRQKASRTSADEQELERLSDLELELKDFRDELLRLAKFWKPNLNDGVQITAAPLWRLFQHRPWQKKLKETWESLEAGQYDWAHLAYSIWPDRVRDKCRTDKSLAIAHGLDELYQEPEAPAKKKRGKKK